MISIGLFVLRNFRSNNFGKNCCIPKPQQTERLLLKFITQHCNKVHKNYHIITSSEIMIDKATQYEIVC